MFGGFFNFRKSKSSQPEAGSASNAPVEAPAPTPPEAPEPETPEPAQEQTSEQYHKLTYQDLLSEVPFAGAEQPQSKEDLHITELGEAEPDNQTLSALVNFLHTDMRIKTELLASAPKPTDDFDESTRMGYLDDLDDRLKSMRLDFKKVNQDFGFDDQVTEQFFSDRRAGLAVSSYGAGTPQKVYQKQFSDLRPDFVDKISEQSCGYSFFNSGAIYLARDAHTVNEFLHAYHSHIMNSDDILHRVPALAERKVGEYDTITLRGEKSAPAREIFESIPAEINSGGTDIIAAAGHIMLMVRGRGHALTVDIARGSKNYEINYHIPKICNQAMIEALPGIGRITPHGANGAFDLPYAETGEGGLGRAIANFIAAVPTDGDMSRPGGAFYDASAPKSED